ncbi:hypothetical protein B0H16DRAFT_10418 [Mycena metata]|uniref:F-box domain-containing protein n=1 Tax=Mycena metata TaxID=1033252 RepID=A0AAD7KHL4_9AGAR|nr:hypothetical protein B0H16DRAFT_10418 [Mycena metata]
MPHPASIQRHIAETHKGRLLEIPMEILEHILLFCHPHDVARFSTTCRFTGDLVHRSADQYFWRQLFLLVFDDPRRAIRPFRTDPSESSFHWKGELVRRMKAERAAFTDTGDRESALETFATVAGEALPVSRACNDPPASRNLEWLDNILRNSRILVASFAQSEAQDKFKTYMALSLERADDGVNIPIIRTLSRCRVYDLRNYGPETNWGPFLLSGGVNWTHMESIVNVVTTNIWEQIPRDVPRPPIGLQAIRAHSAPGDFTGPDWAGVEGTWRRYVCFMDYRDLFAFNFTGSRHGPRDPAFFADDEFREATRLMELDLHLIPRSELKVQFPYGDPPLNAHPDYEILYFSGTSRGASSGQEALVQGYVHMGNDYVPRWRLCFKTSIHGGQPQWISEGAQIGSVGSAIGVAGNWSAFDHDDGDPVGPFWLWKCS